MESTKAILLTVIAGVAGLAGYLAYIRASTGAAVLVAFTAGLMLYLFSSKKRAWKSLSMLQNPFWTAIVIFFIGFAYGTFRGHSFHDSMALALGTGLLGGALGIFLHHYWNIGS
ncbi:MAG: hypothetical protein ABEJ91_03115 [Candidatus Nanohaloarchaea archaeon]